VLPPEVTEPDKKEREKPPHKIILSLEMAHLKRFLFHNFGVELLLLDENPIAMKTDEFLVRGA
jgi:hypothetical protein